MDEKSNDAVKVLSQTISLTDPLNHPMISSSSHNQAILTHDGSIKIILSTDVRDNKFKDKYLSKDIISGERTTTTASTTSSEKVKCNQKIIDLKQPIIEEGVRQVFISTICHVSGFLKKIKD